jgi:cob(I)alamin adenosyltransferase
MSMKIYTRTGDDGTTGLIGGPRIRKCDHRLECTGDIDELNAALGIAAASLNGEFFDHVREIQNDLFIVGSQLATADAAKQSNLPTLEEQHVTRLEMQIDAAEAQLPPLRNFILPGGCELAARLHLARTICRRAERSLVDFAGNRPVPQVVLTYMNRLSDWLFVHARLANHLVGVADVLWKTDR